MPSSVSSRVVAKNGVWSTPFRYSICCSDVSDANEPTAGCRSRNAAWKARELRPIVAGELGVERRERAVDEVDDARLARTGRVVCRNDLRGHGFDVCRFGGAEKGQLRAGSCLPGVARRVHGVRDVRPAQGRGGRGDDAGDGLHQ